MIFWDFGGNFLAFLGISFDLWIFFWELFFRFLFFNSIFCLNILKNSSCKLVNLASPEVSSTTSSQPTDETTNLLSSCERISGELINFDYALVELNCPKGIAKLKMDQAFKILTNGICNNAFVLTMMCSGSRSILYEKIHKR